jgi:hypothetical protein
MEFTGDINTIYGLECPVVFREFFLNVSDIFSKIKKVLDNWCELLYNVRYFLQKEKTKWQVKI